MALRTETLDFLRELERFSDRSLKHPNDVGYLVEAAVQNRKMETFNEAIFLAKFVTKSFGVMKRIGVDGEGYDKLSAEFQASLGKVASLLKDIAEGAPEEVRRSQTALLFNLTQESLDRLMPLLSDLAIVKNWVLDGKQIPQQPAAE
ncbi:hypothetical protein D4R75_15730 [bacterium]|nr:MAG: hypothetical protein D4R75_15730 [bacterium]